VAVGALSLLVILTVVAMTVDPEPRPNPRGVDASFRAGLDALYTRHDPNAAAAEFRKVLEQNPKHYAAILQLATALDGAGKPAEARPVWEKLLKNAEELNDKPAADTARARLAKPDGVSEEATQEATMKAGMDALYARKDPIAAATQFRKVLERNPSHYGAAFQLATALDRAGKPAEARPLWEKVLKMAEGYNDAPTVATARTRLGNHP
jgi:Tfp pilus assembly protein PilF